jgi:hypothetical protein
MLFSGDAFDAIPRQKHFAKYSQAARSIDRLHFNPLMDLSKSSPDE